MTGGGEETAMLRPIAIATAVSGTLDIFWAMILTMTVGKGDIPAMLRFVASGPFGDAPLGACVREAGAAVVEHDRRSGEEAGDEEVPHHPAGRGVPEETVLGAEVAVQAELFEVLDQDAALGLDDRLGQTGRARGVEHPEGVVEGDLLEDRFHVRAGQGGPVQGICRGLGAEKGNVDHGTQGG